MDYETFMLKNSYCEMNFRYLKYGIIKIFNKQNNLVFSWDFLQ